jgi:hypothetical protein
VLAGSAGAFRAARACGAVWVDHVVDASVLVQRLAQLVPYRYFVLLVLMVLLVPLLCRFCHRSFADGPPNDAVVANAAGAFGTVGACVARIRILGDAMAHTCATSMFQDGLA